MVKLLEENSSLSQNLIELYKLILLGVKKNGCRFPFPAAIEYNT